MKCTHIKLYVHVLSFLILGQTIKANNIFFVNVNLEEQFNGIAFLSYVNSEGHYTTDSSLIHGKSFTFKGKVNCFYRNGALVIKKRSLNLLSSDNDMYEFRIGLENRKIDVALSGKNFNKIIITGNTTEKIISNFYAKKEIRFLSESIVIIRNSKIVRAKDSNRLIILAKKYKKVIFEYCISHQNENAAIYILFDNHREYSTEELYSIFIKLAKRQQNSYFGKFLKKIMDQRQLKYSQVGLEVPDFKTIDIKGDSISLYEKTKTSFVLLDFWASWCNPCRESHPFLRKIYRKYHKYGFEIIGISCDKEKDEIDWENAITQDSVFFWPQILTSPPNIPKMPKRLDLLNYYKIQAFPTQILINKKNFIVIRIETEKELEDKLKEIFGE
jgi:thiol-disulfide isomerase/thioredoxin